MTQARNELSRDACVRGLREEWAFEDDSHGAGLASCWAFGNHRVEASGGVVVARPNPAPATFGSCLSFGRILVDGAQLPHEIVGVGFEPRVPVEFGDLGDCARAAGEHASSNRIADRAAAEKIRQATDARCDNGEAHCEGFVYRAPPAFTARAQDEGIDARVERGHSRRREVAAHELESWSRVPGARGALCHRNGGEFAQIFLASTERRMDLQHEFGFAVGKRTTRSSRGAGRGPCVRSSRRSTRSG